MDTKNQPAASIGTGPDRSDCPADTKVKAYANGEVSGDKQLEEHVRNCPWCAAEYRDHTKDLMWDRFFKRSTNLSFLVLAALIFAVWRSCHQH